MHNFGLTGRAFVMLKSLFLFLSFKVERLPFAPPFLAFNILNLKINGIIP